MSIKEALVRYDSISGNAVQPTRGPHTLALEHMETYRQAVLEKGSAIFERANVSGLFQELADVIGLNFRDVKIYNPKIFRDGTVVLEMGWDYRSIDQNPETQSYKAINVNAYTLTGDLMVWSEDEVELLSESEWSSDPNKVENAIVRSYKNPVNRRTPVFRK